MQPLTHAQQRAINGGKKVGPYTMWTKVYKGLTFKWINPTGVFNYKGYFPPRTNPYKYYCSSAIY